MALSCDFIGIPLTGISPLTVNFSASIDYDGDNPNDYSITAYKWYFDYDNDPITYVSTSADTIQHVFNSINELKYSIKLEVEYEETIVDPLDGVPLVAWFKGENTVVDELGGSPLSLRGYAGYDPRYADGIVGRCFRVAMDEFESPNELTLAYNATTNITSTGQWAFRCYLKMNENKFLSLFSLSDDGGSDFISVYADFSSKTIQIYGRNGNPNILFEGLNINAGQWYEVIIYYNNGTWRLFLNIEEKTASISNYGLISNHNYTNYICNVDSGSGIAYIDEVKLYKSA